MMQPVDRYASTVEFYVRYAETDAQGVVHHASYVVWLEEARSHYSRSVGSAYVDFERAGYFASVIGLQVRYRAASRYGDLVRVTCWVEELKSRTVSFGYEVTNAKDGALCATATTEHICITKEGQIVVWPPDWKRALSR
jgi:acyl-CoA thioester hydrolase